MSKNDNSVGICVLQREDLDDFVAKMWIGRFEDREVSAQAAAQILGISISTLNRWLDFNLISPSNPTSIGIRMERKFNLAYLLTLDLQKIKMDYRKFNK